MFAENTSSPEGFRYADDFVSAAEAVDLIAKVADLPLEPFQFGQYEGKRRVASFAFSYDYTARRLVEAEPIPEWLSDVSRRVETFAGPGTRIQQVLCTGEFTGLRIVG